jgi:hypothetical protein
MNLFPYARHLDAQRKESEFVIYPFINLKRMGLKDRMWLLRVQDQFIWTFTFKPLLTASHINLN